MVSHYYLMVMFMPRSLFIFLLIDMGNIVICHFRHTSHLVNVIRVKMLINMVTIINDRSLVVCIRCLIV